jgi:hypothetical protein
VDADEPIEEQLRERAVQLGLDPDYAASEALRREWVRQLWGQLRDTVMASERDKGARQRVAASKLRYSLAETFAAATIEIKGQHTVIVNLGIVASIVEFTKIYVAALDDPTYSGLLPQASAGEIAGLRFANVLGWLSSVARHPIATPEVDLPPEGDQAVVGFAGAAVLFVLAHELAHIVVGDVGGSGHERELKADNKALDILRSAAKRGVVNLRPSEGLPPLPFGLMTDLTVPSAALFLSFEGLRQRAIRSSLHLRNAAPVPSDLIEATQARSHPSPYSRLTELRKAASRDDPDGSEVASIDTITQGFDAILPAIVRNMPEWVVDEAEAKQWMIELGEDPDQVTKGFKATYDAIYFSRVVSILREASRRGSVERADLNELSDLARRMPRTVINALALGRVGRLLPLADKDAPGVHAMSQVVAERIQPGILRAAVQADPPSTAEYSPPPLL